MRLYALSQYHTHDLLVVEDHLLKDSNGRIRSTFVA